MLMCSLLFSFPVFFFFAEDVLEIKRCLTKVLKGRQIGRSLTVTELLMLI